MKKQIIEIIKALCFLLLSVGVIWKINAVVTPKYLYDEAEPHTLTYSQFYDMKPGTVDVIILGSSHSASAFNPQDIYDYGWVRSYNLSSSAQTVRTSYYWLKEALQYQSPKVVILDCLYFFSDYNNEAQERKALDYMRPGSVKMEAVKDAEEHSEQGETISGYFLPFIRYHSRWTELKENDFKDIPKDTPPKLKGFWFYHDLFGNRDFHPIVPDDSVAPSSFAESVPVYLDGIVNLCKEHHIKLVLVKTPVPHFTVADHNAVELFAKKNGLPFYDYNEEGLFNEIGLDYGTDMHNLSAGFGHFNIAGARKASYFISKELVMHGWVNPQKDEQWAATKEFNDNEMKDFMLRHETDMMHYIPMLKDNRYTVFIVVKDDAGNKMTDEIQAELEKLGLKADWKEGLQKSYCALIDQGEVVYEEMSDQELNYKNAFRDGLARINLSSAGYYVGSTCSVKLNDQEQIRNKTRGIHFVVYNNERNCVIDSVGFDTNNEERAASR